MVGASDLWHCSATVSQVLETGVQHYAWLTDTPLLLSYILILIVNIMIISGNTVKTIISIAKWFLKEITINVKYSHRRKLV